MSEEEDFLSRWSRRKRAAEESAQTPALPAAEPAAPSEPLVEKSERSGQCEKRTVKKSEDTEFDPATLPSLDSIAADTDITAFLRKGVPLDLTRAALRRAWASDPGIRDFIGLAENAWDFNDPNAMHGFGSLDQSPEEVRQMLAQVMGEVRRVAGIITPPPDDPPLASSSLRDSNALAGTGDLHPPLADASVDKGVLASDIAPLPTARALDDAEDDVDADADDQSPTMRRTHGGALPK